MSNSNKSGVIEDVELIVKPVVTAEKLTIADLQQAGTDSEKGIGHWLRCARNVKGVSPLEAAEALCLPVRVINALEEEQFQALGGLVFVRGYLRTYGRYLNLKEEVLVANFNDRYANNEVLSENKEKFKLYQQPNEDSRFVRLMPWLTSGIVILLTALLIIWWYGQRATNPADPNHFIKETVKATPSEEANSLTSIHNTVAKATDDEQKTKSNGSSLLTTVQATQNTAASAAQTTGVLQKATAQTLSKKNETPLTQTEQLQSPFS